LLGADDHRWLFALPARRPGAAFDRRCRCQDRLSKVFREFGLPSSIRTDNGVPFATVSLARLSTLSVWWIRLGIVPELIEPGKPQQNGRHERMHRPLRAETTRPPAAKRRTQQRKFNSFQEEDNHLRPHEAINLETPASVYQPSVRPYPGSCRHWSTRRLRDALRQLQRRHALGQ
jgi:transposase InsO family protein